MWSKAEAYPAVGAVLYAYVRFGVRSCAGLEAVQVSLTHLRPAILMHEKSGRHRTATGGGAGSGKTQTPTYSARTVGSI
jgi:hypothetical protein